MASDMGLIEEPVSRRADMDTPSRLTSPNAELWLESAMEVVIQVDPWASGAIGSTGERMETIDGSWSIGAQI